MVICVPPRLPGFQLLRDTFAGKNLTESWRRETDSEKWSEFYRQKCRAAAEILGAWEDTNYYKVNYTTTDFSSHFHLLNFVSN